MSQSIELTAEHCQILEPLTSKVRVLTYPQIARTFDFADNSGVDGVASLLAGLEDAGKGVFLAASEAAGGVDQAADGDDVEDDEDEKRGQGKGNQRQ